MAKQLFQERKLIVYDLIFIQFNWFAKFQESNKEIDEKREREKESRREKRKVGERNTQSSNINTCINDIDRHFIFSRNPFKLFLFLYL